MHGAHVDRDGPSGCRRTSARAAQARSRSSCSADCRRRNSSQPHAAGLGDQGLVTDTRCPRNPDLALSTLGRPWRREPAGLFQRLDLPARRRSWPRIGTRRVEVTARPGGPSVAAPPGAVPCQYANRYRQFCGPTSPDRGLSARRPQNAPSIRGISTQAGYGQSERFGAD